MFVSGAPQYPLERTLLATGAIDAAMRSRHAGGAVVPAPPSRPQADAEPCSESGDATCAARAPP
jgi:hypothetical protein